MVDVTNELPTSPGSWVEYLGRITAPTLLAIIIVTGAMHMWRWGSDYDEMRADRDQWKSLAMKGTQVVATAANRVITGDAPRVVPPTHASKDAVSVFLDRASDRVTHPGG